MLADSKIKIYNSRSNTDGINTLYIRPRIFCLLERTTSLNIEEQHFSREKIVKTGWLTKQKVEDCSFYLKITPYENTMNLILGGGARYRFYAEPLKRKIVESNPECNSGNCEFTLSNLNDFYNYRILELSGRVVDNQIEFLSYKNRTEESPIDFIGMKIGGKTFSHQCQKK